MRLLAAVCFVGCLSLRCFSLTADKVQTLDSTRATRVSLPDLIDARFLIDAQIDHLSKNYPKDSAALDKWRSLKAVVLGRIGYLKAAWPDLNFGLDTSAMATRSLQEVRDLKHIAEDQISFLKGINPPDPDAVSRWRFVRGKILSRIDCLTVELPMLKVALDSATIPAMTLHQLTKAKRVIDGQVKELKKARPFDEQAVAVWQSKGEMVVEGIARLQARKK
jgi:hypothetical protein